MSEWKFETVIIVGLGYVGLPLAIEFAKKFRVVGYDKDVERVIELRNGRDRNKEFDSTDILVGSSLSFTFELEDLQGLSGPTAFIVTVPTPVDSSKNPDFSFLRLASATIGSILKRGDFVIYESTVFPGATEEICIPVLEEVSKLKCIFNDQESDEGFHVGYSPERINPGDQSRRLIDIKKITSGTSATAARYVDDLYSSIIRAGTHRATSIRVAEAAKVIENAQRDLNIAFVNELALIFNKMGLDTIEVLTAAETKWNFLPFKPGLVGGHCIGVDPYYLTAKAQMLGYHPEVILAGRRINDGMAEYVVKSVLELAAENNISLKHASVGVFGVTFKENCADLRNSRVLDIVRRLQTYCNDIEVVDPWATPNQLEGDFNFTIRESVRSPDYDIIVVAVSHSEFLSLTAQDLRAMCRSQSKPIIFDIKSIYDKDELVNAGFTVMRL